MHSLVTGGTGFVGRHLISRLDRPVVLGRDPKRIKKLFGDITPHKWDQKNLLDTAIFQGVDTVFHLAGESVFQGRWNTAKKNRILHSRVDGTRNLVDSLSRLENPPSTLISASAIGYYGEKGETVLTESAPPGGGFLAQVCTAWEEEAARAETLGIRVVMIRIGVVLGKDGGALAQMITPFRFGMGGKLGTGKQFMSWIHIDDLIGVMLHAANTIEVRGPVNGTAPEPVTNSVFTKALAEVLHRPTLLNAPGWALKISLGEFAEVLLGSQRVVPDQITRSGYNFLYTNLSNALQNLIT